MTKYNYQWRTCLKCLQQDRDPTKKIEDGGALFYSEGSWNRLCEKHRLAADRAGIPNADAYPEMPTDVIEPIKKAKEFFPADGSLALRRKKWKEGKL